MPTLRLWKPFGVLCQFREGSGRPTLADLVDVPDVYPAGRLDFDSEGLVVLTDQGWLQARLTEPKFHHEKEYWVQVEGVPGEQQLAALRTGVELNDGMTRPARAEVFASPPLLPPGAPVRERADAPTSWLKIVLTEGRNRQVRRMTAAIGHPTVRLVRWAIGNLDLRGLEPGRWEEVPPALMKRLMGG
ncbi:MAG: pseudouridine synthase [Fimbriimonadaceae bacterium]|nr:pseudouridine synthase [Fimbriimonadaceae bacterium]QYK54923.1 MAG: pseudouridine synthase [Fimbriimonadaceae bacterium]